MAEGEDVEVMELLRAGDVRGAVDSVYRLHSRNLRAFLRDQLNGDDSVEEVVAETFKSLMRDLPAFRGESKLKTWLFSVAHHAMLRHAQKERLLRERVRGIDSADENRALPDAVRPTLKQWLIQLYNRLDSDEKRLIDLWAEGWTWLEVAEHTGGTEEGARKRFTRLMKRFHDES